MCGGCGGARVGSRCVTVEWGSVAQDLDVLPRCEVLDALCQFRPSVAREFEVQAREVAVGWGSRGLGYDVEVDVDG